VNDEPCPANCDAKDKEWNEHIFAQPKGYGLCSDRRCHFFPKVGLLSRSLNAIAKSKIYICFLNCSIYRLARMFGAGKSEADRGFGQY
jgi:hypothetical protein